MRSCSISRLVSRSLKHLAFRHTARRANEQKHIIEKANSLGFSKRIDACHCRREQNWRRSPTDHPESARKLAAGAVNRLPGAGREKKQEPASLNSAEPHQTKLASECFWRCQTRSPARRQAAA
jgi:hypothetical protein